MTPHVTIFGTSLSPDSRSQILAREALRRLTEQGISAELIDLRDLSLPESDRAGASHHADVRIVQQAAARASHLLFAVAIYNYDASSAAKNLLELLTSEELLGKVAGFLCTAGGHSSYMSVMAFANSLMLDYRCWIVPRFVYATSGDFTEDTLTSEKISERIDLLLQEMFVR